MRKSVLIALCILFLTMEATSQIKAYKAPNFRAEWALPSVHPDHIVLNLTENPSNSMSVTWRTSMEGEKGLAQIAIATGAPKFWRTAKTYTARTETHDFKDILHAGVVSNYHSVTFENLEPDTMYAYRVGDGDYWSEWLHFRTASTDKSKPFSFLYVGDAQNYIMELWSRLIREGFKKDPEMNFVIHAGDLVNHAHSEREWHEWFEAGSFIHSMVPSFPVTGNHEHQPRTDEEKKQGIRELSVQWRPTFTLPENGIKGLEETVYYVDYQDARIVCLNTNKGIEDQVAWLEGVLKDNPQKWTILSFHHPIFSASERRNNEELRTLWKPIIDKYKVDLVLQGHDHSYARGRAEHEANYLDGVNMRDNDGSGTVYVVSVSGGKMYRLRPNAWGDFEGAKRERAAENTQLFQLINVHNDTLNYKAYTAVGELYDAFSLIKRSGKTNEFIEQKSEAIAAKRFANTIAYHDPIPSHIQTILNKRYPGYEVSRSLYYEGQEGNGYRLRLIKDKSRVYLTIDESGKVLEEEKY